MGLVVFLEVGPVLATYAPALFPALAVVGALNLAMISRQEQRDANVKAEKAERKAARQAHRQTVRQTGLSRTSDDASRVSVFDTSLDVARQGRMAKCDARLDALVRFHFSNPDAGPTEAGHAIGVSHQTIYTYLAELESTGRITRKGSRHVEVLVMG